MDNGPGYSLMIPSDLKINAGNDEDIDEDAINDQRRREELLRAQLAGLDDDGSEEDEDRSAVSSSGDESNQGINNHNSNRHYTNGMIFHNLSDVIEHSPNNSLDDSVDSGAMNSANSSGHLYSPSRRSINLHQNTSRQVGGENFKPILKNNTRRRTSKKMYKPIFSMINQNDKSEQLVDNSDVFAQQAMDGRGDENYQTKSEKDNTSEKQDIFQSMVSMNHSNDGSHLSNSDHAELYRQTDLNSMNQLKVLYQVRLHEIKRLTNQLETERQETAKYKDDMFRKLSLLEAEKERAVLSRTEANKLLVSSKEEIDKLQKEVKSLTDKILKLEKEKSQNEESLEVSRMQIQELEQRIALMERCDPNKSIVKLTDVKIQQMKTSHQQEIRLMQNEIDSLKKKFSEKDEHCRQLEKKLSEDQRMHEAMLVEKADTINQLAHSLEESQAQCRQLMAANVSVDNIRLQTQLDEANKQREQLTQTVYSLETECKMMKSDLAQYESVSRLTLPNSQSSSDETDSIIQLGIHSRTTRSKRERDSNINSSDLNSKLREELHRALLNQKAKRAEINRLQEIINDKEEQIKEMTNQERRYLSETESMKEQLKKMMTELTFLQDKTRNDSFQNQETEPRLKDQAKRIEVLNSELEKLRLEKEKIEKDKLKIQQKFDDLTNRHNCEKREEIQEHDKEYLKFHDETVAKLRKDLEQEAELQIKEYRIRLEHSLQEVTKFKEMYVSLCESKELLTQSLTAVTSDFEKITKEKEMLAAELKENIAIRDQLAKKLNDSSITKKDSYLHEKLMEERDRIKSDLDKCVAMKDQLVQAVHRLKGENEELSAEIQKLKNFSSTSPNIMENHVCEECSRLREELTSMSTRHTQELSAARAKLQDARDRVLQLEKSTRQQFETELKTLRQDRDMLRTKCDEKEVQIKKLIDSRKRPPPVVHCSTQTDALMEREAEETEGGGGDMQRREERHSLELARCREEYERMLAAIEQSHQQALVTARDNIEQLKHNHQLILEDIKEKVEMREAELLATHKQELMTVEERTKQMTVKYFAEEVKKLEAKYKEEANQKLDTSVIETLHKSLVDRTKEVESLKHRLVVLDEEWRQKLSQLQSQVDKDKESIAQQMVQWATEVKSMEGELKLKEVLLEEQREKLEKTQEVAKKYKDKFSKTNDEIKAQYMSKCTDYKSQILIFIEECEKDVNEKIKQMEEVYQRREKELKRTLQKMVDRIKEKDKKINKLQKMIPVT